MSCRSKWAGASVLAITMALSLGEAQAAVAAAYNWNTGDYTNTGTIDGGTTQVGVHASGSVGTLTNSGTISGNSAVNNTGAMGALTNNGSIDSISTGVGNQGTIGTLTNSGNIHADQYGVYNYGAGTINTLSNSGTIVGGFSGVCNEGSIGRLTNTGTITGPYGITLYSGSVGTLDNQGTIVGTNSGVYNASGLGTLTNSGIIISGGGGSGGIVNDDTIGRLDNRGTIVGYTGINNVSIGTLTNSGTISGNGYAIYNYGTIGTLTNSGVIAGNIYNRPTAHGLSISGGSGTIFGTLTGFGGAIGTITHTGSDLAFAGGNLVLNDHINATGRTVRNTGATLRLDNTVTITGAYTQTAGGLISTATGSGASNAKLVVDGDANISNSTITVSGAGLSAGQTFTIVDATAGHTGTYTDDSARVAVTNGLAATVSTVGNDLVVTLIADTTNNWTNKGAAAGGTAAQIGAALDAIRTSTAPAAVAFRTQVLDAIDALPTSQQGSAIKQLAPITPSPQMSTLATNAVVGAVNQHQQTAMAYAPVSGVAAGSEARDTALWGQFLGGGARRGTNAEADGYRLSDVGLATGIDHHFTPDIMGGAALSWVRAWSKGSDNSSGSSATMDSYQLTLYGTYRLDRAFIDGQLGAGWNEFDQKRGLSFLGTTAQANYSGQQYLAKVGAGYDVAVGGDVTVTPMASLRWLRSETDAYDETGAGAANLSVARNGVNSVTQDLGAKVAWSVPTPHGTLKPEARLAWVHDYTKGPIATNSVAGGQVMAVSTPRTQADGVRIGLGAELSSTDDLTFRAEYEGELRAQYQSHTALIKTLWGF